MEHTPFYLVQVSNGLAIVTGIIVLGDKLAFQHTLFFKFIKGVQISGLFAVMTRSMQIPPPPAISIMVSLHDTEVRCLCGLCSHIPATHKSHLTGILCSDKCR